MKIERPIIIQCLNFEDERGSMYFENDFHFEDIKRFYFFRDPDASLIWA